VDRLALKENLACVSVRQLDVADWDIPFWLFSPVHKLPRVSVRPARPEKILGGCVRYEALLHENLWIMMGNAEAQEQRGGN
jgi:hypothetical protein